MLLAIMKNLLFVKIVRNCSPMLLAQTLAFVFKWRRRYLESNFFFFYADVFFFFFFRYSDSPSNFDYFLNIFLFIFIYLLIFQTHMYLVSSVSFNNTPRIFNIFLFIKRIFFLLA
uniref:Uncharacterized protein n=1 Tax=Cacopsylla melanoneura TaxID=428564 RepID=A0A8D8RGM3_9HEMI